jgi:hypothetical protein
MFKLRELPSTVRHPLRTHILKFPPTKNWRGMIVVVFINQLGLNGERVFSCVSQFGESNIFLELVVTIGLMLSSLGGERLRCQVVGQRAGSGSARASHPKQPGSARETSKSSQ